MELTIKFLTGKTFTLKVDPCTTVGQLKSMIQQSAQVPSAQLRLSTQNTHRTDLQEDSKTLQNYGLQSGCTVVVLILQTIQVFLRNPNNQTHTYEVSPGETVSDFKRKVQNKENVLIQQQRLVFESRPLEDGHKLEDYGIKDGSTIQLLLRLRGG